MNLTPLFPVRPLLLPRFRCRKTRRTPKYYLSVIIIILTLKQFVWRNPFHVVPTNSSENFLCRFHYDRFGSVPLLTQRRRGRTN